MDLEQQSICLLHDILRLIKFNFLKRFLFRFRAFHKWRKKIFTPQKKSIQKKAENGLRTIFKGGCGLRWREMGKILLECGLMLIVKRRRWRNESDKRIKLIYFNYARLEFRWDFFKCVCVAAKNKNLMETFSTSSLN